MKKKITLILAFLAVSFIYAQNRTTVQVLVPESVNLSASDSAWLPGLIQDKLKENAQSYLNMTTIADSEGENAVKKLQAQAEDSGRDENTAIELGKITTAKFALFSKIRKSPTGYSISVDYMDLTTTIQKVSVSSKEYSQVASLYGSTGAVDEITLKLAEKLGIMLSDLNKNLLSTGSSSFSLDEQLELARQNEAQFNKMMADYDADLARLSTSNDINAIQNKKKIEAEKALLAEKQNAEKKRQQDLQAQKKQAEADAQLESERSIALKTQRDNLAKQAAEKAAQVRKAKIEKQGILSFITTLESKKAALVGIRQGVEERSKELHTQMKSDETEQAVKILTATWTTVEMKDGQPTEAAKQRRANKVWANNDALLAKFYNDCESVKQATMTQQNALVADINADYATLAKTKTVSSMGDELKVSYGTFDGDKYGWNAYLSLYSDGVLLFSDTFIVKYETLAGKAAPAVETATDAQLDEYANNVDMYNSLLVRGDPILYFELDYNAVAAPEDKPSMYTFNFSKVRAINTVNGKVVQTSALNEKLERVMKPEQDLREIQGVVAEEKNKDALKKNLLCKGCSLIFVDSNINSQMVKNYKKYPVIGDLIANMIKIPNRNYEILKTEVTQSLYKSIMQENPSAAKDDNFPVTNVSIVDAVYFCNKLSEICGFTPVYVYKKNTDVSEWDYIPHSGKGIKKFIGSNPSANGFRLPTRSEWQVAALARDWRASISLAGEEKLKYLNEIGEVDYSREIYKVAGKKANAYGLFDMMGNACEWVWSDDYNRYYYYAENSYQDSIPVVRFDHNEEVERDVRSQRVGFRIVRTVSK